MSFTSLTFLAFLAGLIVLYYVLPRKLQWMLLLAASCAFYLCGGAKTIGYLAFTALTTYAAGRRLGALNAHWRKSSRSARTTGGARALCGWCAF